MKISPTALSAFTACKRKWFFRGVVKLPRIPGPAAEFGIRFHKAAERWFTEGETPDFTTKEGRLFAESIPLLPARSSKLLVEHKLDFSAAGIDFIGYVDLIDLAAGEAYDHKTSSDPKRWGLTESTLPDDPQAIIYSHGLFETVWPERSTHRLNWVYSPKNGGKPYPVRVRIQRDENCERMRKKVLTPAREMIQIANGIEKTVNQETLIAYANAEIENNPSACGGFGRNCDFAAHCQIYRSKSNMALSPEMQAKLDAIKAKQTGKVNPPESGKALEETAKETAATTPAQAPAADEKPAKRGRPKGSKTAALEDDLAALVALARQSGYTVEIRLTTK